MKLISHDLQDGGKLPNRHVFNGMGYDGDNISPHLMWDDVPAGTKSFVVTCYDPDAPTGSGWWHWVVANLPADTRVLPQGAGSGQAELPEEAVQTRTDFGKAGYGGAAPPKGETRVDFLDERQIKRWSDERKAAARHRNLVLRINRIAPLFADELIERELESRPGYFRGKSER